MRNTIQTFFFLVLCVVPIFSTCTQRGSENIIYEPITTEIQDADSFIINVQPLNMAHIINMEEEVKIPDEDIELIALVTMAEAEGECEEGQRLVIDTILNRVDSDYFPDTVYDVIYQPNQFSSMWNGRLKHCEVKEDICELVKEEFESRTNQEVVFFTAGNYSKYGMPMFQIEHHYFSSYN